MNGTLASLGAQKALQEDFAAEERRIAAGRLGLGEYAYCPERDAEHDPGPAAVHDREMPAGYLTVQCRACGQTTGVPMPDADTIDWG